MVAAPCPQFRVSELNLANGTPLGAGALSQVIRSTLPGPTYLPIAVKIISKLQLLQQHKVDSVMNEKAALVQLYPYPFVGRLLGTSQSEDELYFVMEWLPHGDLLQHIRRTAAQRVKEYTDLHVVRQSTMCNASATPANVTHLCSSAQKRVESAPRNEDTRSNHYNSSSSDACAVHEPLLTIPLSSTVPRALDFHDIQLITAQLVLALDHVVEHGLVLRDLKPENIVFDDHYRACLIDFDTVDLQGSSRRPQHCQPSVEPTNAEAGACRERGMTVSAIREMRTRTAQFCGTAQYVSPEMVHACCWSFSSDLWSLGAVVYEMMYGVHMFAGTAAYEVLCKVMRGVYGEQEQAEEDESMCEATTNRCVKEFDAPATTLVAFPVVDLGPEAKAFERVKDFILRLMRRDPRKRLGVRPDTLTFDRAALQAHPLFDGFDWEVLMVHVRQRDALRWTGGSAATSTDASSAQSDVLESLQSRYHMLPYNDDSYAEYVYRATADANPFERYMSHIHMTEESKESENEEKEEMSLTQRGGGEGTPGVKNVQTPCTLLDHSALTGDSTGGTRESNDDDSESDADVVDDVGVQCEAHACAGIFS